MDAGGGGGGGGGEESVDSVWDEGGGREGECCENRQEQKEIRKPLPVHSRQHEVISLCAYVRV